MGLINIEFYFFMHYDPLMPIQNSKQTFNERWLTYSKYVVVIKKL